MTNVHGTVLVTGGTGGLGQAVVGTLLEDGCRVVASWVAERERDRLVAELGERDTLVPVQADIFDAASVAGLVAAAADPGPITAVVNLVGGFAAGKRVHESDPEEFRRMLHLNLTGTYLVTRAALPQLVANGSGSIVTVSARPALQPFSGAAGYVTAKAGVLAFTQALAVEYRDDGVRANAILPSVIDTPGNRAAMPDADHSKWVQPAEIGRVIRFLCSADSAPTSGAAIPVYGRA